MNKEQILNVMDHVDPALIEGIDGRRTKKRLPPIARTGLIAACLCAALVGTAFAAEILGIKFVEGMVSRNYFAYGASAEVKQWALSELGETLQNDVASGVLSRRFFDRESMVEYLGVPLLYSDMWEQAEIDWYACYEVDGGSKAVGAEKISDGEVELFRVASKRVVSGAFVTVSMNVFTEYADPDVLENQVFLEQWIDFGETVDFSERWYYDMNCGDRALIVASKAGSGGWTMYSAYFVHEGILYRVCMEMGGRTALIEQLLDSFELCS